MLSTDSKIFITGATGFVGSYIVKKLVKEGYTQIYCLRRKNSDLALTSEFPPYIQWVTGDILDIPFLEETLMGMDIVIHAAAEVTFELKHKDRIIKTAMTGTANLVNISLDYRVKKFVHISSIAAIGRRKKIEQIDEKNIFSHSEFDTSYGLSKFLAEQEVWRGCAEGLDVTILNPSMILGAGFWNNTSVQIFKKIFEGMRYYPEGINGWVDVRDVAQGVLLALNKDLCGERFIISAENVAFKTIFEKIAAHLQVKPPVKVVHYFYAGILYKLEAFRSMLFGSTPIITKETIKSTSVKANYQNQKSIEMLGMRYRSIDQTIIESCNEFLETWPRGKFFGQFRNS